MIERNVINFVSSDSVAIPLEQSNYSQSSIAQVKIDQGATLSDFTDDVIISYRRVKATVFYIAKNELLRRGESKALIDRGVQLAVQDSASRVYAIKCGQKIEQLLETGVKFSQLDRNALLAFYVNASARLANAEDEFDRRGLNDPADPQVQQ